MKWKLSRPGPAILVYYFMKMFGLAPITANKNGFYPPTLLSKLYSVSVATIHLSIAVKVAYFVFRAVGEQNISEVGRIGVVIQFLIGMPSSFSTVMIFLFMHKRILHIMNKLRVISNELRRLGVEQNEEKFIDNTFATIVKTNAFFIPVFVTMGFLERYGDISFPVKYFVENWVYINAILVFTQILLFIRQRFELLNGKLYEVFGTARHRRSVHHPTFTVMSRNPDHEENQGNFGNLTDLQSLREVEALYLELCDLVEQTTHLFAIPILLKSLQSCTDVILHNFWQYYSIRHFDQFYNMEIVPFVMDMLHYLFTMAIVIYQFLAVAQASEKTCKEGNAMRAVLFRVWYKFKPHKLGDEFLMFSLQLLHKPVTVSAFGLVDLGYSCPYKALSIVVTFVIILIQSEAIVP